MIIHLSYQFLLAYLATICFAIILNVPKEAYNVGGLIGGVTWCFYVIMYFYLHVGLALSNLVASIFIAFLSMVAARNEKQPMILYNVPALVTFVPGCQAYKAVRYFVVSDYVTSLSYLYQVIIIAGTITLGFGLGDLLNVVIFGRSHRWYGSHSLDITSRWRR